jgi:hypothetical protein
MFCLACVIHSLCFFLAHVDRCVFKLLKSFPSFVGIRDHIISKSRCVCGATNILADDLLPNKTLRDTINRILETNTSSAENAGSLLQVQGILLSPKSMHEYKLLLAAYLWLSDGPRMFFCRYGVSQVPQVQSPISFSFRMCKGGTHNSFKVRHAKCEGKHH